MNDNGLAPTGANSTAFTIGNRPGGAWFDAQPGLYDDVRVFNTALDAASIEAVRASAVPEPSAALAAIAAAAIATLRRRRR